MKIKQSKIKEIMSLQVEVEALLKLIKNKYKKAPDNRVLSFFRKKIIIKYKDGVLISDVDNVPQKLSQSVYSKGKTKITGFMHKGNFIALKITNDNFELPVNTQICALQSQGFSILPYLFRGILGINDVRKQKKLGALLEDMVTALF